MSKMSVACVYLNSAANAKAYTFACDTDLVGAEIKQGDYVIVEDVEDVNEYSVVKVTELDVTPWGPGERSVIQKLEVSKIGKFRARAAAKKLFVAQLKAEAERINNLAVYESMAKDNPKIAELLGALKELS